jgi:hypothetical protein
VRRAQSDDVVAWLNDASFRLLEARLARARARADARADRAAAAVD